jgi:hypothetical protein
METISVSVHFDGERILLDEPIQLEPDTKLLVTILPKRDVEHEMWLASSGGRLADAYGPEEEGYPLDSIKEATPEYEGR